MKLKNGFILKKVMGSYMVISTDESAPSSMQTVNETGAFLWALLEEGSTIDQMCEKMVSEYEIDPATAKRDIELFVSKLRESDLLED